LAIDRFSVAWRSGCEVVIRSESVVIGSQLWPCNGWTADRSQPRRQHSRKLTSKDLAEINFPGIRAMVARTLLTCQQLESEPEILRIAV